MNAKEQITQLEKENAQLKEQVAGLVKALEEAKTVKATTGKGKSHSQAQKALEMLTEAGAAGITTEQLAPLNEKYPSDPIYYVRSLLKKTIVRQNKRYYLAEFAPKETPKAEEPKEAVPQAKTEEVVPAAA